MRALATIFLLIGLAFAGLAVMYTRDYQDLDKMAQEHSQKDKELLKESEAKRFTSVRR